jgi:hypothetical protein
MYVYVRMYMYVHVHVHDFNIFLGKELIPSILTFVWMSNRNVVNLDLKPGQYWHTCNQLFLSS